MEQSHGMFNNSAEMHTGSFAYAHGFTINNPEMNDFSNSVNTINIDTQIISNPPTIAEPLSPLHINIPRTSRNFVGQYVYLERLREYFGFYNNTETKIFLLYGMGGIGKTQICLKFNDEMKYKFSHVFWIDSSSEETITLSLKEAYKMISPADTTASSFSAAVALHKISSIQSEWLMIYDNADGAPELIEKYLPPGNSGNILITSRNPALQRITSHNNAMEIVEMNEVTAIELLFKTSGADRDLDVNKHEARIVVQQLHYLPLAIDMAGAYISQVNCEIKDFNNLYTRYRPDILNHEDFRGQSGYNKTVYRTFEISYEKILQMSTLEGSSKAAAARYALTLLNLCAFFHYENISKSIFERAAKHYDIYQKMWSNNEIPTYLPFLDASLLNMDENYGWNEWLFTESISLLLSFSLIKRTTTKTSFNLHPLVQTYCQDRLAVNNRSIWSLSAHAVILISVSTKLSVQEYMYMNEILPHFLMHANNYLCTKDVTYYDDIFILTAKFLLEVGKYNDELNYRLKILEIHLQHDTLKSNLGTSDHMDINITDTVLHSEFEFISSLTLDPNTIFAMGHLAWTYHNQGKWGDAENLQVQVLEMRQRISGIEHPETMSAMSNLALTYMNQRKWGDAEYLQAQVLEMRQRISGREHSNTMTAMTHLAWTYHNQGKWGDAENLQVQVLEMRQRISGREHPHTMTAMTHLASTYMYQGKYGDAEHLQVQVLEMRQRISGREYPHTMTAMAYLAHTYMNQKKYGDAENLQVQVLEMRQRISGREHPHTMTAMNNLALTYRYQGKYADAEILQVQVLELRHRISGIEHPNTMIAMNNLALTYRYQGKYADAEILQVQVLEMRQRISGREHPDTMTAMANLALTYMNQGKLEEAENLKAHILTARQQMYRNS